MVFKKELMIKRLTEEGRADEITQEALEIMDALDGHGVEASCWRRVVLGEPVYLVYLDDEGWGEYVYEGDCA